MLENKQKPARYLQYKMVHNEALDLYHEPLCKFMVS